MKLFQTNITSTTHIENDATSSHILIDCLDNENSRYQLFVTDYLPYIYVEIKTTALEVLNFLEAKNITVEKYCKSEKMSIYGYQEENLNLVKLFFNSVSHCNGAKKALDGHYSVFNANIPFMVQFMVDLRLKGMTYIEVNNISDTKTVKKDDLKIGVTFSSAHSLVTEKKEIPEEISSPLKGTPLGMLKYVSFKDINPIVDDSLPSFMTLSFDIETSNRQNRFPDATVDPIIQIGNTIKVDDSQIQIIFCVGETASIDNADVRWFETEKEMLQAWFKYIFLLDYDTIIGYNITGFDLPYVLTRAKHFGIGSCLCRQYIERTKDVKIFNEILTNLKLKEEINTESLSLTQTESTLTMKTFKQTEILAENEKKYDFIYNLMEPKLKSCKNCNNYKKDEISDFRSRLVVDMMNVVKKSHSLRSYTLNNVSLHILQNQKEDIPYYLINGLYNGDEKTRRRIAVYCLKDTLLPLLLYEKLVVFFTGTEMARVLGVPINWYFNRGISIKIFTLILRQAKENNMVIPLVTAVNEGYEGAVVLDPERGYYDEPIAVLDFASLYPSIIIAHNLCYTTLVLNKDKKRISDDIVTKSPIGTMFINKEKKKGILPVILESLLSKRKEVKSLMAKETDPLLKSLLNARQNAFKVAANSLYGFTGSTISKLPCLDIGQTITGFGREMIIQTKNFIESTYNPGNGYNFLAKVIYGDTDSVMIKFFGENVNSDFVFDIAGDMAKNVSKIFVDPIKLEFEKIYYPYLLMKKKRYAGVIETRLPVVNNSTDENDVKRQKTTIITKRRIDTKGIETVRRDNCRLVKHLIEESLDLLLMKRDPESAKLFVKNTVRDLYLDKIDMSMLVISKTLSKNSYSSKQAHVELAERMKKRDNIVADVGDRIAFVIIDKGPKVNAYEKSEDPLYVLEHDLPLDVKYYIDQQISKPVQRLFEPLMDNVNELFTGDHIQMKKKSGKMLGPMAKFVNKSEMCISCRAKGSILCKMCEPNFFEIYTNKMKQLQDNEQVFNKCWRECQRCIQSVVSEVICANTDCPIFFKRTKARKELDQDIEEIRKLESLSW